MLWHHVLSNKAYLILKLPFLSPFLKIKSINDNGNGVGYEQIKN